MWSHFIMAMTAFPQVFLDHWLGIHKDKLRSKVSKFVLILKLYTRTRHPMWNKWHIYSSFLQKLGQFSPPREVPHNCSMGGTHYWWIMSGLKINPQSLVLCCWLFLGNFLIMYGCFQLHSDLHSSCLYSEEASCIGFLMPCQKPSIPSCLYLSLVILLPAFPLARRITVIFLHHLKLS